MQADYRVIQRLVREEIEHIVARAAQEREILRAGERAYRIMKAYPNCGMTGEEVVNDIIAAASTAGVVVEISREFCIPGRRSAGQSSSTGSARQNDRRDNGANP